MAVVRDISDEDAVHLELLKAHLSTQELKFSTSVLLYRFLEESLGLRA